MHPLVAQTVMVLAGPLSAFGRSLALAPRPHPFYNRSLSTRFDGRLGAGCFVGKPAIVAKHDARDESDAFIMSFR